MKSNLKPVTKLALAGMFCAVAVVGSMFIVFPVLGSKCAPVQHMVNILCAVLLGPWYGVAVAFVASLVRNLLCVGSRGTGRPVELEYAMAIREGKAYF